MKHPRKTRLLPARHVVCALLPEKHCAQSHFICLAGSQAVVWLLLIASPRSFISGREGALSRTVFLFGSHLHSPFEPSLIPLPLKYPSTARL